MDLTIDEKINVVKIGLLQFVEFITRSAENHNILMLGLP